MASLLTGDIVEISALNMPRAELGTDDTHAQTSARSGLPWSQTIGKCVSPFADAASSGVGPTIAEFSLAPVLGGDEDDGAHATEEAFAEDSQQIPSLALLGDRLVASPPSTPRARTRCQSPPPLTRPSLLPRPSLLQALQENSAAGVCSILQDDPQVANDLFWDHRAEAPLSVAIRMKCCAEIVQALLEHGADINALHEQGREALERNWLKNAPESSEGRSVTPPSVVEPSPFLFPNVMAPPFSFAAPPEHGPTVAQPPFESVGVNRAWHDEVRNALASRIALEID